MRGPAPAYDPDMALVRFVVISGIPGSGKSTVGERIAPLLGLLGTVVGMIDVFDNLMREGSGNANLLAGGYQRPQPAIRPTWCWNP